MEAWAQTPEEVINPKTAYNAWVSDMAHIIDDITERQLNALITELEQATGVEIAVVTIRRAQGRTPKDFATELLNRWGIGKKGQDNGILILLSVEDRRIEVETGYGLEGVLPDGKVGAILDTYVIPHFRAGDYSRGLLEGVRAIAETLRAQPLPSPRPGAPAAPSFPWVPVLALLIGGAAIGYGLWRTRRRLCSQCRQPMRLLTEEQDDAYLEDPQKLEEELGSVDYRIWRCDECQTLSIERLVRWFSGYEDCPRCGHRTVFVKSYTLREPTYEREGLERIERRCRFPRCSYRKVTERRIPRRERPPIIIYGGGGLPRGGWPSASGGWSIGGGFGGFGGGSFGGGSSGGGGAGRSW